MVRQSKKVITSHYYEKHLIEILEYGILAFGYVQARKYFTAIANLVEGLDNDYNFYPECRYLATKNRIYRNIILDSHLIIYRIKNECIEVLDIIHSASSISKIRKVSKVKW